MLHSVKKSVQIIFIGMFMANPKGKIINKGYGTVMSPQEKLQRSHIPTGRPDLNEIKRRNEEEEKRDKKSIYNIAGIMALAIVVVIVLIYFFG